MIKEINSTNFPDEIEIRGDVYKKKDFNLRDKFANPQCCLRITKTKKSRSNKKNSA